MATGQGRQSPPPRFVEAASGTIRRAQVSTRLRRCRRVFALERDVEDEILPTLRELGIGLVATVARPGFLTGQFRTIDDLPPDDYRRNAPRFQGENFRKNLELVKKIEELAAAKRCTPSQLALAWCWPGGRHRAHPRHEAGQVLDDNSARSTSA